MINKKIKILRKKFKKFNIDGYAIPKNDEFFSEYAVKDRLKTISNFNGSAGLAIILKKKKLFICRWEIHNSGSKTIWKKI